MIVVEGGTRKRQKKAGISKDELYAKVKGMGNENLHWLVGLDAATGEELWDMPMKCLPGGYGTPGGPRAMALAYDGKVSGVILTQYMAVRAKDGKILSESTGTRPAHAGYIDGRYAWSAKASPVSGGKGPSNSAFASSDQRQRFCRARR